MTGLANFQAEQFLQQHWQREALLIKGALPGFEDPLSAEELAGLALEDAVEARIIRQLEDNWKLDSSPIDESSFDGDTAWTLLVQAVDHYLPAVAELRRLVNFLPTWRVDDVMVSYATDGGGVGPHYDNYDVFLLQGAGRRRWRLGQRCDEASELLPNDELRILKEFETTAEYVLEPGDILYVPPRLAHWGEALGNCMTYSIGLRAPRTNDMLSRWLDELLAKVTPESFYADPSLQASSNPGEITGEAYEQALVQLRQLLQDTPVDGSWFGELVTEPRYPDAAEPLEDLPACIALDPASKLAWMHSGEELNVFANGESLAAGQEQAALLQALCRGETLETSGLEAGSLELLGELARRGCLIHE
ncbi:MAG: cupin domain-containing protein [Halieaceae bacterium]